MTRDEIIRMARKADIDLDLIDEDEGQIWYITFKGLERFAALVAAAKEAEFAERLRTDVHSCHDNCQRVTCVAVREAVQAEREALLDLVNDYAKNNTDLQDAIRARDNNA